MRKELEMSRRDLVKGAAILGLAATTGRSILAADPDEVTDIGSRLELFVEKTLIGKISGGARLQLHRPTLREISFVCDKDWEGSSCAYMKVFKDGDLYRMYYRGSGNSPHQVTCYAESKDGLRFTKPELYQLSYASLFTGLTLQ